MYLGISACQTAGVNCTQYNDFDIKQKQFFLGFLGVAPVLVHAPLAVANGALPAPHLAICLAFARHIVR